MPAGVIYQSWQDGKGTMIQLWRDPSTGEYGLKQFHLADGSYSYAVPLTETAKPEQLVDGKRIITEHPVLIAAGFADTPTPITWLDGRELRFRFPPR